MIRSGQMTGHHRPPSGRSRLGATALLLALAVGAGCSTVSSPRLSVTDASLGEVTDEGRVVVFQIEAANRNDRELPLREVRYRFSLEGREVFRGVRSSEASVRRFGRQTFRLPVVLRAEDIEGLQGRVRYTLRGEVTYLAPGALAETLFDTGVSRPKTSFSDEGVLDLGG